MTATKAEVYIRSMLSSGKGLALWQPRPCQPRGGERGVVPGDVGSVSAERGFKKIFNLWENEADIRASNVFGGSYCPPRMEVVTREELLAGDTIVDGTTSATRYAADGGLISSEFEMLEPQGAVLALTSSADLEELESHVELRDFIVDHAVHLYQYANGIRKLDEEESLYIITGCIKSDSWAIAAYNDPADPPNNVLRLVRTGSLSSNPVYRWTDRGTAEARYGPGPTRNSGAQLKNQCLFLQGFKIAFSAAFRSRTRGTSLSSSSSGSADPNPGEDPSSGPTEQGGNNREADRSNRPRENRGNGFSSNGSSGDLSGGAAEKLSVEDFPMYDMVGDLHPCDRINREMLDQTTAEIALSHDDDWRFALANASPRDVASFDILETHTLSTRNGVAFLMRKQPNCDSRPVATDSIALVTPDTSDAGERRGEESQSETLTGPRDPTQLLQVLTNSSGETSNRPQGPSSSSSAKIEDIAHDFETFLTLTFNQAKTYFLTFNQTKTYFLTFNRAEEAGRVSPACATLELFWLTFSQGYRRNRGREIFGTDSLSFSTISSPDKGVFQFINAFFGKEVAQVSSETTVKEFECKRRDGLVVSLVDTPGFNSYDKDSQGVKTDVQILQMMSSFLDAQQNEAKIFSGTVFLHSINSGPLPQTSKKFMRTFKRCCGNDQLKNVVVATTRWDESCYDGEALQVAEESEQSLVESLGLLKDLSDAGVRFLRTGHFDDNVPQPSGDLYQSPLTIVEQLLGLEPEGMDNQEHAGEEKAIQEHDPGPSFVGVGAQGWAKEEKPTQNFCDTGPVDPPNEPETLKQDLGGRIEHSRRTPEDSQSPTNNTKSERMETNEDLEQRFDRWRERLLSESCAQWNAWEDRQKSLIADQLVLFGAKQDLGLKNSYSEMKQAIEICQKERHELRTLREHEHKLKNDLNDARLKALDLQTDKVALLEELNKVKSALAEQTTQFEIIKMENGSIYTSGLRSQLEELKNYRDLVNTSRLETELELERTREAFKGAREELETQALELARLREQVQAKTSESEVHTQRIASLETELEEGKKRSEELAEESTRRRNQAQARMIESERRIQQIPSLEAELAEEKKKSEELVQESTLLRDQLQAKTTESELHTQRITSLETELAGEKRNSEEQAQESARLRKRVQAKGIESEQYRQRVASLEKDTGEWKKRAQESTRLRKQLQDKTANGEFSMDRIASLQLELEEWKKTSEEQTGESTRLMREVSNKTAEGELHAKRITSLETELEAWKQRSGDQALESEICIKEMSNI
ncbi:hypothetical protein H1R20_g115, partial [Candolleomyces eurysporus]